MYIFLYVWLYVTKIGFRLVYLFMYSLAFFGYVSLQNESGCINLNVERLNLMKFQQFITNNDGSNFNQDFIDNFFDGDSGNIENCNYFFLIHLIMN